MIALLIRLCAFVTVLGLLPGRTVLPSVRAALVLSMVLWIGLSLPGAKLDSSGDLDLAAHLIEATGALSTLNSDAPNLVFSDGLLSAEEASRELLVGLYLGVLISAAAYAAQLLARWLSLLLAGAEPDSSSTDLLSRHRGVECLVLLVFLSVLFHSEHAAGIWTTLGRSLTDYPIAGSSQAAFAAGVEVGTMNGEVTLIAVGAKAFSSALLFVLPLLFLSLAVDASFLLFIRYFPQVSGESLTAAARLPLLIFGVSMMLYPFSTELGNLIDQSLSDQPGAATSKSAATPNRSKE